MDPLWLLFGLTVAIIAIAIAAIPRPEK